MAAQQPAQDYVQDVLGPLMADVHMRVAEGGGRVPQPVIESVAQLGAMVKAFPTLVTAGVSTAPDIDSIELDVTNSDLGHQIKVMEHDMPWLRPQLRALKGALNQQQVEERVLRPALEQNGLL